MTPTSEATVGTTNLLDLGLNEVLDMLSLGVCVIDPDLNIHEWNVTLAEWTGIPREEALGSNLGQRFPNLREPRYGERIGQVFTTGTPAVYSAALHRHVLPIEVKCRQGTSLMIQKTQVRLISNSPPRALLAIGNVTPEYDRLAELQEARTALSERARELEASRAELEATATRAKEANTALRQKNEELAEFAYVASHDLQEPLRKLISFSNLLRADLGDDLPERADRDLEFITDAARRMRTLVEDLLQLSRAGSSAMRHEPIALQDCVNRALEALAGRIEEVEPTITSDDLPITSGDPTLLTQLYQNLIGNALKFVATDRRPSVQITAEKVDGEWQFGVLDNGIGIKEEHFEQVFTPFKRLHGCSDYEGTGIGLAICRKVVERHGGRLWVESNIDRGSHFKFTLGEGPAESGTKKAG